MRLRRVPGARVQVIQLLWHPPGSATGRGAEDELNRCVGQGRRRQGVARSNGMQEGAQGTRCGAGRSQELNSHMRASAPLNMFDLPLPLAPTDTECAVRGSARADREARAQKQTENLQVSLLQSIPTALCLLLNSSTVVVSLYDRKPCKVTCASRWELTPRLRGPQPRGSGSCQDHLPA